MIIRMINSLKCRIWNPMIQKYILKNVYKHGEDITIGENVNICGYCNLTIGSHVYIGDGTRFLCTEAPIYIGDYCMFGPEVMIITGNHRINKIGEYMYNVKDKLPENDEPVIINDDVWIGARAIILKGTNIGKGSVIAAGAIVSGLIPEYSIYYAKDKIRPRFNDDELRNHVKEMKKND